MGRWATKTLAFAIPVTEKESQKLGDVDFLYDCGGNIYTEDGDKYIGMVLAQDKAIDDILNKPEKLDPQEYMETFNILFHEELEILKSKTPKFYLLMNVC